jgi:hypothetical protein
MSWNETLAVVSEAVRYLARGKGFGWKDKSSAAHPERTLKRYETPKARNLTLRQATLLALGSLRVEDTQNQFMQLLFSTSHEPEVPGTQE